MSKGFIARYMAKLEENREMFLKSKTCENGHQYLGHVCNTCHYLSILRGDYSRAIDLEKRERKTKKKHDPS